MHGMEYGVHAFGMMMDYIRTERQSQIYTADALWAVASKLGIEGIEAYSTMYRRMYGGQRKDTQTAEEVKEDILAQVRKMKGGG